LGTPGSGALLVCPRSPSNLKMVGEISRPTSRGRARAASGSLVPPSRQTAVRPICGKVARPAPVAQKRSSCFHCRRNTQRGNSSLFTIENSHWHFLFHHRGCQVRLEAILRQHDADRISVPGIASSETRSTLARNRVVWVRLPDARRGSPALPPERPRYLEAPSVRSGQAAAAVCVRGRKIVNASGYLGLSSYGTLSATDARVAVTALRRVPANPPGSVHRFSVAGPEQSLSRRKAPDARRSKLQLQRIGLFQGGSHRPASTRPRMEVRKHRQAQSPRR
jgi:hypothetical protein